MPWACSRCEFSTEKKKKIDSKVDQSSFIPTSNLTLSRLHLQPGAIFLNFFTESRFSWRWNKQSFQRNKKLILHRKNASSPHLTTEIETTENPLFSFHFSPKKKKFIIETKTSKNFLAYPPPSGQSRFNEETSTCTNEPRNLSKPKSQLQRTWKSTIKKNWK